MSAALQGPASFETLANGRGRLVGQLHFNSVGALLPQGEQAIAAGQVSAIDLADVTESDSAGLALLIEWLSFARASGKPLRYENVPNQIREIAHLTDVEDLLECHRRPDRCPEATPPPAP